MTNITICLTSCGRFDLLERTIKSLVEFWDGPKPAKILVYEDSKDISFVQMESVQDLIHDLAKGFDCERQVFFGKVGQIKAIDHLYNLVETPYIFHCEDDWQFTRTGFIQQSLNILEEFPKISEVWLRHKNERNGHPQENRLVLTKTGTRFYYLRPNYRGMWHGTSFGPTLRRKADYDLIAPYAQYLKTDSLQCESEVGKAYYYKGFRQVTLLDGYVKHIGQKRALQKK